MVAFEHVLSAAFANGPRLSASAATAPIVKVLSMLLRFMFISYAFEI
jgi:hypothetical protein